MRVAVQRILKTGDLENQDWEEAKMMFVERVLDICDRAMREAKQMNSGVSSATVTTAVNDNKTTGWITPMPSTR